MQKNELKKLNKIVITGGHHSSALPVIKLLLKNNPELQIYWFGHKHSLQGDKNTTLEFREISDLDIPFYELKAGKFYKTFNLKRLLKIPYGFFQSIYLLVKIKPDIVMSFGGYIAVPVVISAKILNIPSLTHEQTVVAGYANKLISKFATKVLVSWESSQKYFDASKTIYTGLPLREEIFHPSSNEYKLNPDLPTAFVIAGKSGSHLINMLINDSLDKILENINLIHQCGDYSEFNDYETLSSTYAKLSHSARGIYNLTKFVYGNNIGEAYAKSNFVLSRSGAHISMEIVALKKPTIFIPISWVSHNEQYENAKIVSNYVDCVILDENKITSDDLLTEIKRFSSKKYKESSTKVDVSVLNATKLIVEQIYKVYEAKSKS